MIIADENIDKRVVAALIRENHKITYVAGEHAGISDKDIIHLVKELAGILITMDKDFGKWVFAHGHRGFNVVLLRYDIEDIDKIIKNVILIMQKLNPGEHRFISVSKDKIRERKI
jgi:predicted nuclease of predicted toxin-antitoxin system